MQCKHYNTEITNIYSSFRTNPIDKKINLTLEWIVKDILFFGIVEQIPRIESIIEDVFDGTI